MGQGGREVLLALVSVLLFTACPATPTGPQDVIQAKRIEIVDEAGQVTAVIEGSSVVLMDSDHQPRVRLEVADSGPELVMLDNAGRPKADLSVSMSDPSLMMGDLEGNQPQLQATVASTGSGLWLRDMSGRTQAEISVTPHGTSLTMRESETDSQVALGLGQAQPAE